MPVHQFGLPADMDGIMELARRHKLIVIEDAACAIGSHYKGKPIGSLGNVTCFSFHPRKVITTGEGGMVVTDDADLAARARVLRNHGVSISDLFKSKVGSVEVLLSEKCIEVGYNYRMTNLQGALGVAQMERLDEILALRRMRAERYSEAFTGMPCVIPPHVPDYVTPNWQSYAIRISNDCPVERNAVVQSLLDAGVECRPSYPVCHLEPAYRNLYPDLCLPNTEKALGSVIILPLYPQMMDEEQEYVIEVVSKAVAEHKQ
jgi:dTDP-4-amino-4,6-dideoxygalactose transaminase